MKRSQEKLFAVTAPGLETVCAGELAALGITDIHPMTGGVEFSGGLPEIYRANLWLRSAGRVVVRVGEARADDFPELFRKTVRLPWGKFLRPGTRVQVRAVSRRSRLGHTGRISATVTEAIDRSLGHPAPASNGPEQLVLVRFEEDVCLFSVDSSGELLHRRGYRLDGVHAPLRETLAAGILQILGWDGSVPLTDPMCGSGTFVIEGGLIAENRAPGLGREFAFMHWPRYRPGLWEVLTVEANRAQREPSVMLNGSDRDPAAVEAARRNAGRAAVRGAHFQCRELAALSPSSGTGLVVCNPPYGERLERGGDLKGLFHTLGRVYCESFRGWRGAILCPDETLARAAGMAGPPLAVLVNGGIRVGLYALDL
ncbi:MAG: THUMP domain-containing protein [Desulfuromonadales bacterium]